MFSSCVFLVSKKCNQSCEFCLNVWKNKTEIKAELSFEQQCTVLDKLKDLGIRCVVLTGGEPLLNKNIVKLIDYAYVHSARHESEIHDRAQKCSAFLTCKASEHHPDGHTIRPFHTTCQNMESANELCTYDYANKIGLKTILQTNGVLLNQDIINKIKNKVLYVQVSLHGTKKEHNYLTNSNNFDKVIDNIKLLVKNKIKTHVYITLTKLNYTNLNEFILLLASLGVNQINFTKLYLGGMGFKNKTNLMLNKKELEHALNIISRAQNKIKTRLNIQGPLPSDLLKKYNIKNFITCVAGRSEFCVQPDGSITLCPSWPKVYGNILVDDVNEVFNMNEIKNIACKDRSAGCLLDRFVKN